jgi:tellurite resistance protein TerC
MVDLLLPAFTLAETLPAATSAITPKFWAYAIFIGLVIAFLALDLGVFHREAHEVTFKEAVTWSVIWVVCGMGFAGVVYGAYNHNWLGLGLNTPIYNPAAVTDSAAPLIVNGTVSGLDAAKQYLTGYVVEKSLAMDNIFVIAMIFGFFAIPAKYQHRVLFWGIIGALLMRGAMIGIGAALILEFMWILIIFGAFLLLTALKMALIKSHGDPGSNIVVRIVRRYFPVTTFFDGQKFITRRTEPPTYSPDPKTGKLRQDPARPGTLSPRRFATPLLLALIMVEVTDLVFAVDSIPAIFAITPDPFIVFTSNIFAILGLRALYFCLAAMIARFRYLKPALILILAFVGVKLLLLALPPYLDEIASWIGLTLPPMKSIKIDTTVSLLAVVGTLAAAVVASLLRPGQSATFTTHPRQQAEV